MPIVACKICARKLYVKLSHQKRGWGKYCSKKCQFRAQRKGQYIFCNQCGKKVWKSPTDLKRSKSKKFFCSKSCQTLWRNKIYSGTNHPFWKGGEEIYRKRLLLNESLPVVCSRCGCSNRKVLVAHHKDENRKNNDVPNLEWLCRNCHYLIHKQKTL